MINFAFFENPRITPQRRDYLYCRCLFVQLNAALSAFLIFLTGVPPGRRGAAGGSCRAGPVSRPSKEGTTVNRHALVIALVFLLGGAAQAATVDLTPAIQSAGGTAEAAVVQRPLPASARTGLVALQAEMSELPEPEVFAMMLLGLVLIGYRASRDSDEKFK
jgi:hypothetical protein